MAVENFNTVLDAIAKRSGLAYQIDYAVGPKLGKDLTGTLYYEGMITCEPVNLEDESETFPVVGMQIGLPATTKKEAWRLLRDYAEKCHERLIQYLQTDLNYSDDEYNTACYSCNYAEMPQGTMVYQSSSFIELAGSSATATTTTATPNVESPNVSKQDEAENAIDSLVNGITAKVTNGVNKAKQGKTEQGKTETPKGDVTQKPETGKAKSAVVGGPNPMVGYDIEKRVIQAATRRKQHVCLVGYPGTGKTSLIEEIAFQDGRPFTRVNLDGNTDRSSFVGEKILRADNGTTITDFVPGPLLTAMTEGHYMLCDEINAALPDVLFVLQTLLDGGEFIRVTEDGNRVVKPHKDFRFFAAMNPTDDHAGTKELNRALEERLAVMIPVDYLSAKDEIPLLTKRTGIDADSARLMVTFANKVRELKRNQTIETVVSTRMLLNWCEMTLELQDIHLAYRYVIRSHSRMDFEEYDRLWSDTEKSYKDFITAHNGQSVSDVFRAILDKEKDVEKREARLKTSEKDHKRTEIELQKKEDELAKKYKDLDAKQKALTEREKDVEKRVMEKVLAELSKQSA